MVVEASVIVSEGGFSHMTLITPFKKQYLQRKNTYLWLSSISFTGKEWGRDAMSRRRSGEALGTGLLALKWRETSKGIAH